MFIHAYTCTHFYVDVAGDMDRDAATVAVEKPQAEERTREEGGKEEGRGNAERG